MLNYSTMLVNFKIILGNKTGEHVANTIGGKIKTNIDNKHFRDHFCAIRMSYCLNHSGCRINKNGNWKAVSGDKDSRGNKLWYIYTVKDLAMFIDYKLGKVDENKIGMKRKNPKKSDFINKKGILYFDMPGHSEYTGHLTLWDGFNCSDDCYFDYSAEATLWFLQ